MSLFVIRRVDERGQEVFYRGSPAYIPAWSSAVREAKRYDTAGEAQRALAAIQNSGAAAEVTERAVA